MKKTITALLVICLIFAAGCAAPDSETPQLQQLTVCLDWIPNINHAGLYAAQANEYFAAEGLEVKIVQPGDNYALQLVAAGQAEFGFSYQEEVTFARSRSIPVRSVAAVIQHNTSCFAATADKNIHTVADIAGKTYGGWGGQVEEALLAYLQDSLDFSEPVHIRNIGSTDFFAATESGEIDFSWIFYGVTGVEAQLRGVELDTIWLRDLDPALDYYTPVIAAEESWLMDNEEIARAFLRALSRGYAYADAYPAETAVIMGEALPEINGELLAAGLEWMAGQYIADAPYWGYQREGIWQGFGDWLYQRKLLAEEFDGAAAFTNEYLPQ